MRGLIFLPILLLATICGCMEKKITNETEDDTVSVLMVIAPKDFRDEELFEPLQIFKENGFNVDVVSTTRGEHVGMLGLFP